MKSKDPNTFIIEQLRQEVLELEGRRLVRAEKQPQLGLGPIERAFRGQVFPRGTIHEFSYEHPGQGASSLGFIAAVLGRLLQHGGYCLWITGRQKVYPLGLSRFGLAAERIFFLRAEEQRKAIWAMEEALKSPALVAVVGELSNLSFAASRRLQLAVEDTGVTGIVYRSLSFPAQALACSCRWRIRPLPGVSNGVPGLSHPRWRVELTKSRTGIPDKWDLEWVEQGFRYTAAGESDHFEHSLQMQTG